MENKLIKLSFNVDDMSPEDVSFACNVLFENKANDVYVTPVYMKKNRLGSLVTLICKEEDKEKFLKLIFENTTTLGVKEEVVIGHSLERHIEEVNTNFGKVRLKISSGFGVYKEKFEYEDLAKIAKENNISILEVKNNIKITVKK